MRKFFGAREVPILMVFLGFYAIAALGNHRLFTANGIRDILFGASIVSLLAIGQTLVIVQKHIDLSTGSVIGFSSYLIGRAATQGHGLFYAMALGIFLGLAVGALNGALVSYFELPSLVVTLGTLYLVRGAFNQVAGGDFINSGAVPKALDYLATHSLGVLPYLFVVPIILALIVGTIMRSTRAGRDLYAIGSNFPAAKLAGINVKRRTFLAFTAAGAISGFSGSILLARFGQAEANAALGIELNVVAACVVGGVAIAGGVGTVYGAIIGGLLLETIALALGAVGVSQFWQGVVNGALLIAAISLDKIISSRGNKNQILRVGS